MTKQNTITTIKNAEESEKKDTYKSDNCETWADLELSYVEDPTLRSQLKSLREASRNYRKSPDQEKQLDLFTPPLADLTLKDELSIIDIAPFGLAKSPRFDSIKYELKNANVTITGSNEYGIATIYDYDIVLYMVSYLAHQMELIKQKAKKGESASFLPPRTFRPNIAAMLKFCRRQKGGKQAKELEKALLRLKFTGIVIQTTDENYRRTGTFSYIQDFAVISRTKTDSIADMSIEIPRWIYDGIVRPTKPSILTLDNDYFLLKEGIHRFLHRFARKTAGTTKSITSVQTIYRHSGSKNTLTYFTRDLKNAVKKLEKDPLPDYKIELESKGRGKNFIICTYKKTPSKPKLPKHTITELMDIIKNNPNVLKKAQEAAPSYDIYYLLEEWAIYALQQKEKGDTVKNPHLAFIGFCKNRYKIKPNL